MAIMPDYNIHTMDKVNSENIGILFPMMDSHIVHYYPNAYHITCVVRIRVSNEIARNLMIEYPISIDRVGKRMWLQVIYDVAYQEHMPAVMQNKFTSYLSRLQLMVAHQKLLKQKERIDHLRKQIDFVK